jgi:hypothetical protein
MSNPNNANPELPLFIDVGGDRYYLGADKPMNLAYKSRIDFVNTFLQGQNENNKKNTEYLLRKYMYYDPKSDRNYKLESNEDRIKLIKILEKRMESLEASKGFSSSVLKNSYFQRTYLQLQKIIEQLKQSDLTGATNDVKRVEYLKKIPKEKIFQLVFEMSWYLLQPEKVPKDLLKEWTDLIKQLDSLRLTDLIAKIHEIEKEKKLEPLSNTYNYFKKMNIGKYAKRDSALEDVIDIANESKGEQTKEVLKQRLEALVKLLQLRTYLDDSVERNEHGPKVNITKLGEKLSGNPISASNPTPEPSAPEPSAPEPSAPEPSAPKPSAPEPSAPKPSAPEKNNQKGGGSSMFDKKLGRAMNPLFEFFKSMFDPIYGFLDSSIHTYFTMNSSKSKQNIIPGLLILLHICLNIRPTEGQEGGQASYGVYRLTNVPSEVISFIRFLINKTEEHIQTLPTDEEKRTFHDMVFEIPKIHLTSLLNPLTSRKTYKYSDDFPYLQIFTVGDNLQLPPKEKFLNSSDPKLTEQAYLSCSEFFQKEDMYLVVTKPSLSREEIPMNLHTIDFSVVDVETTSFPIDTMPNNYFHQKQKEDKPLFLEKLVQLTPYSVCNDGEIAMSVLIAFKETMPK